LYPAFWLVHFFWLLTGWWYKHFSPLLGEINSLLGISDHVTSRGIPTGDAWSGIAQLLVAHERTPPLIREPNLGSRDVWWRPIRWKDPTRANIAQLLVAHTRTLPR
jgi:hypothetical protein